MPAITPSCPVCGSETASMSRTSHCCTADSCAYRKHVLPNGWADSFNVGEAVIQRISKPKDSIFDDDNEKTIILYGNNRSEKPSILSIEEIQKIINLL